MRLRLIVILLLFVVAASAIARAEEPAAIAPRAEQLLRQASAKLAAAKTLSVRADVTVDEVGATGQKLQGFRTGTLVVRRPDRLFSDWDGDTYRRQTLYDGRSVTVLDVGKGLWASFDAAPTLDATMKIARDKYGLLLPLGELVSARPIEDILPNIQSGIYVGTSRVEGTLCHHVAFTLAAADWQLWIQDGAEPLIRKIVVTYKTRPQSPQFTAVLRDWRIGDELPDSSFKLEIPKDASRIQFAPVAAPAAEVKP